LKNNKNNLLFFGELTPKSIHGASISNSINIGMLSTKFNIYAVEEVYDFKLHNIFSLNKIFLFLKIFLSFLIISIRESYKFYYGVVYLSSFGMIKNIATVIIFRLTNPKGKIILHFHRSDFDIFYKKRLNRILFYILNILVDKYIVLSEIQKKQLQNYNFTNLSVLYNTIENEINLNDLEHIKVSNNTMRITFISNLIKEKGIIELIEAIKILNLKYNNFYKLDIFGNKTNEILNEQINTLLLNDSNIRIHNPITGIDKFNKIFNSDILILPSYNEGLPLTLLECIYLDKPIIISNVGYISEVLGEDYPLYCKPRCVDSIINKIQYFTDEYFKPSNHLDTKKNYSNYSREEHKISIQKIFN
jgi:glycosyltransferase involved in cell wall biosynthesis